MVPHGMAVSLTAPEAFRFTFDASPERHLRAAELLGGLADRPDDDRDCLPAGADRADARHRRSPTASARWATPRPTSPDLVEGAVKQQRLLATAPKDVTEDDLAAILDRVAGAVVTA